jgi:hypothetical protein
MAIGQNDSITKALYDVDASDETAVQALALHIIEHAERDLRTLLELWRSNHRELAGRAKDVLGRLEALALHPLLRTAGTNSEADDGWLLQTVDAAYSDLRTIVATRIDVLLGDNSVIPRVSTDAMANKGPHRRVCDEAFALAQRLMDSELSNQSISSFFALSEEDRDERIDAWKESEAWLDWVEEPEMFDADEED